MGQRVPEPEVDTQIVRLEYFRHLLGVMFDHPALHAQSSIQQSLLLASILRVSQTASGVQLLADGEYVEEIQAMSRTLVEVTVNAAYLQRVTYAELQRFLHFHPEAVYRQVALLGDGKIRAPGITSGILDKLRSMLAHRPAADRPRETGDPTWSANPLMERAAAADHNSGIPIMELLMERVYPRGHGALHGTIDSLEPFLATLSNTGRRAQPGGHANRHAEKVEALFAVNLCLFTLCLYLNQSFDLHMDLAIEEAARARIPLSEMRSDIFVEQAPRPRVALR